MITTREYISLIREISTKPEVYNTILKRFGDNELEVLDVIRRTHNKIKKIYEDRRMFPNWDLAPSSVGVTERLNLEIYELRDYCSAIEIEPEIYEQASYNSNQYNFIQYKTNGQNITKLIDL